MAVTLAFGFYFGSLIVALSGIAAHRKAKSLQVELERLQKNVNSLLAADERRLLHQLKSSLEERRADGPTIPYPEIPLRERMIVGVGWPGLSKTVIGSERASRVRRITRSTSASSQRRNFRTTALQAVKTAA